MDMRAQDRWWEAGRERAGAAPAARTTTSTAAGTARRTAAAGKAGCLVPEAAAVLPRAVGNAFSAARAADERHRHGAGREGTAPVAGRCSPVEDVLRTPGRAPDDSVRADMEPRLGADFCDVRVHPDAAARASGVAVNAPAHTSGSHGAFRRRYDGSFAAGRQMPVHEPAHVIQRRTGPAAGTDRGDGTRVSDPSDRFEREAEAHASRVRSRHTARAAQRGAGAGRGPRTFRSTFPPERDAASPFPPHAY